MQQTTEALDINPVTGEILVDATQGDLEAIRTTKIKVYQLLSQKDFVMINGTWEATRDGLIKILSSLPISYSWIIQEKVLDHNRLLNRIPNRIYFEYLQFCTIQD